MAWTRRVEATRWDQPALPAIRSLVSVVLAALVASGCAAPGGKAETDLVGENSRLQTKFVAAAYVVGPAATSVYLSDVPLETLLSDSTPVQVVHLELLWRPIAGMTPMDSDATNVSIRHVLLVDGQVGIYGGAGFVRIRGEPGEGRLRLSIQDATIGLLQSSEGFEDLLSPAQLEGDIVAVNDAAMAMRLRQAISQRVTDAFGVPRFVLAAPLVDGFRPFEG